jgi:hypothetical protein
MALSQAVRRGLPLYEDLLEKIRALSVAHGDETSWRHDGNPYWAWYAGNRDLALYHLDAHRSAEAAQSVFGERFGGTLVADGYASLGGVVCAMGPGATQTRRNRRHWDRRDSLGQRKTSG